MAEIARGKGNKLLTLISPMSISGKLEIKISEFPADVQTDENNWKSFDLDCDGTIFTVTLKPKVF